MTPTGTLTAARQVADAVLYEGYLLYPYRASSPKNQVRWQFGILGPDGAAAGGVGEESAMSSEMLVEAHPGAVVAGYLRFLQVQARVVERWTGDSWLPVPELRVGGTRWIPFHEAVPREIPLRCISVETLSLTQELPFNVPAGEDVEELRENGELVGRLVRTRWALQGLVRLSTRPGADSRLVVLCIQVSNSATWAPAPVAGWSPRDVAARRSFVGTHLLLTVDGSVFVSLLDGPDFAAADAKSCDQQRCWPVLIADDDGYDAVLVSPIILGDHPSVAPESAGDLFDATEIDEILTLRVMTLTDDEKVDARGTDPRAAAILARCDGLSDEALHRLHGARRPTSEVDLDEVPVYGDDVPWWDAGQDAKAQPLTDAVTVAGVPVANGSRVLLRPSRRADAQDLFLAGMTAVVERVYFDVDGGTHLAVVLEDDPARDICDVTGRFYYFAPEEIEPLPTRAPTGGTP
jgi:hypothetical protein